MQIRYCGVGGFVIKHYCYNVIEDQTSVSLRADWQRYMC